MLGSSKAANAVYLAAFDPVMFCSLSQMLTFTLSPHFIAHRRPIQACALVVHAADTAGLTDASVPELPLVMESGKAAALPINYAMLG